MSTLPRSQSSFFLSLFFFVFIFALLQSIQAAIAATAVQALGSAAAFAMDLKSEEIKGLVARIEETPQPADRLQLLRTFSSLLAASIHVAARAAKAVLALPVELEGFDWQASLSALPLSLIPQNKSGTLQSNNTLLQ